MPKPTDYDRTHLRNMAAIGTRIDRIFKKAAEEAAKIGASIKSVLPEDKIFSFDDYPATKKQIERLMQALKESMEVTIVNGVESAWTLSNNKNNALVARIFGEDAHKLPKEQYRRYFSTNGAALDAFLQRKEQGLNLSDRVWRYTNMFKREIEMGLDLGIRSGESAAQMTRSLRQYLQYPDKLFRRIRDKHGNLQLSKAAQDFHPGQGVYRSSYKNARRLAATETNIAYRTSDYLRWQQMDFVVGIEIKLSNNHTLNGVPLTDICDKLKGRYPKDFKFTGWHPHCRCHAVTILKTDEEMAEDTERILAGQQPKKGSVNTVRDVPKGFSDWIADNAGRIDAAESGKGSLPYFIRDNRETVDAVLRGKSTGKAVSIPENGSIPVEKRISEEEAKERERIEANRKEYERLSADPNYTDVEFNPENGGLKATHVEHEKHENVDSKRLAFGTMTPNDLEKECQGILYDNGFSCILNSEHIFDPLTGKQLKVLDTTTNGRCADMVSLTENGEKTIKNALDRKKKQIRKVNEIFGTQWDCVILHFHDSSYFNEEKVRKGLGKTFKQIICALNTNPMKVIIIE